MPLLQMASAVSFEAGSGQGKDRATSRCSRVQVNHGQALQADLRAVRGKQGSKAQCTPGAARACARRWLEPMQKPRCSCVVVHRASRVRAHCASICSAGSSG